MAMFMVLYFFLRRKKMLTFVALQIWRVRVAQFGARQGAAGAVRVPHRREVPAATGLRLPCRHPAQVLPTLSTTSRQELHPTMFVPSRPRPLMWPLHGGRWALRLTLLPPFASIAVELNAFSDQIRRTVAKYRQSKYAKRMKVSPSYSAEAAASRCAHGPMDAGRGIQKRGRRRCAGDQTRWALPRHA